MKTKPTLFFSWLFLLLTIASCGPGNNEKAPLSDAKALTSFSFENPAAVGTIDENARTIAVTVPFGTNVTSLNATFTTTGASVAVGSTAQVSGTTANDYSNPVVYVVTAADGTTATYTVTVTAARSSAKALSLFIFSDPVTAGSIDENAGTVSVAVPFDTDVTALVATFITTGVSVSVNGTAQVSGTSANDYSNPVLYEVTAADGTKAIYTVTIIRNAEPALDVCLGGPIVAGRLDLRRPVTSSALPGLALSLGTKQTADGTDSSCVPVYLEVANKSTDPVTLSASQAGTLSALSSNLYGPASLMSEPLAYASGIPISAGATINPGESIMLLSLFSRDRITLYSVPPLGGGTVTRSLDVQAPFGVPAGSMGISRLDFIFDLDFGTLPLVRVPDPGAGTLFVEGELLVGFKAGTTLAQAETVVAQQGGHLIKVTWSLMMMQVSIPFDKTTDQMITSFTALPQVRYAERNGILGP